MSKIYLRGTCLLFTFLLSSCGAYFNQPFKEVKARIGENTSPKTMVANHLPKEKTVVGVYKFRDQTGQYKPVENGSTFSTAVTQGGTAILLKSLEESKWFTPIERENISNLLNERQIIRSTRQEYSGSNVPVKMPPLLFAGIIIEGGVVSYDSNIITGGSGLRYFGVGASNQYRQDRITVYLRAVSTSSGKVLKNVYVSKTILSQGISANLFRYVALRRLLEVETGVTKNEPAQLAVKEAIDKAVDLLIVEGVIEGLWQPEGGQSVVSLFKDKFFKEKNEADNTLLFNRKQEIRRARNSMSVTTGMSLISGDYSKPVAKFGFDLKFKYLLKDPRFSFGGSIGKFELENARAFKNSFLTSSLNFEYNVLPYDRFTPYLYIGIGSVVQKNLSNPIFKYQYGIGLEYLITNKIGFIVYGENNQLMSDGIDTLVRGEKNDFIWRVGAGINVYF